MHVYLVCHFKTVKTWVSTGQEQRGLSVYHLDFELKFQRCILNDASFFGLTLNELTLDECKLHDVEFREGNFESSTMCYCDFTHSLFMRTNLQKWISAS